LPIVLIATLATLMLSSGAIVTGELLRTTAPGAVASSTSAPVPVRSLATAEGSINEGEPAFDEPPPQIGSPPGPNIPTELAQIEQLALEVLGAGKAARKITVLGNAPGESVILSALTLARLIARSARVVLVDLSGTSPTISAVSVDPIAPGLAELMQGEASFSEVITKDRLSRVHLVSAGRPGFDHALLRSPRLNLAVDALLRVYDYVLLEASAATDLPAELLTSQASALVVPDASIAPDARALMCDQLKAVGFSEVTMLSRPVQSSGAIETGEPGARVAA
jgi:Mrp family chromosome partitioning ATPase